MSLVRLAARTLFAGFFIADGVDALRKAPELAPDAESATKKAVPLLQRALPSSYSSSVPEEPETWVRIGGGLKVAGGVLFATGIGRRLGAAMLVPATLLDVAVAAPAKDASQDERKDARREMLVRGALLGGALLGAMDLQGRPSLGWRAEQRRKVAAKHAAELSDRTGKMTRKARKQARKAAKRAKKQAKKATR